MSNQRGLPPKGHSPVGMPRRKHPAPGNPRPTAEEARQMQRSQPYKQIANFPLNYRPGQTQFSGSQSSECQTSESFCKSCYDMNPLIEKSNNLNNSKLDPGQMRIMLRHVLETSDKCPFCNLLMCLFRTYVDDAEKRIKRDQERPRDTLGGPQASVSSETGHPVVLTFHEGIHARYSITRDPIVGEPKYEPGNLYYPPPIQVYRTGEQLSGWRGLGQLKDPEQRVNENFQFFKDNLKHCRTYHESICGQGGERLPKRLIYIGATDADTIKLIEPSSRDSTSVYQYVAVSHRWADSKLMFRTLHENIKDRFQRIDKKRMPRVLQDAIKVTRALALRYLWMDTICMIQDDVEDKKKEMPYMGEYYANAIFTIAASSSADSTVPFIDRRHVYYKPKSFPFQNAYVQARVLGVEGHLAKRGWTWQESTFSSRVLNFTPSELVWECKGMVESECGYDPQLFNSLGLAHKYGDLDDHSDTQAFALWRDCIQAYSDRKLSDFTDCLPAVSGLAKSIKKRTQSNYYAGIWVKDMVPSLLWDVRPSFNREKSPLPKVPSPKDMDTGDPKECTAPSWSWASVEGWVKTSEKTMAGSTKYASYPLRGSGVGDRSFAGLKQDANIEVVGRDSRRLASDDFLGDMRAVLKVEGRLIQVRLICDWDATTGWAYKLGLPNGSKTGFNADTELEPFTRLSWPREQTVRRSNVVPTEYFTAMVHCILIAKGRTDEGLVLGRSEYNDDFMRLGFFSFDKLGHFNGFERKSITIA